MSEGVIFFAHFHFSTDISNDQRIPQSKWGTFFVRYLVIF